MRRRGLINAAQRLDQCSTGGPMRYVTGEREPRFELTRLIGAVIRGNKKLHWVR